MKTIGMFEAKTHFSELVGDALRGETTVVTKHGKPVAEISPVQAVSRADERAVLERIRKHGREICARNGREVSAHEVKAWINEERRYR
jgi:prevent-host-death family protein